MTKGKIWSEEEFFKRNIIYLSLPELYSIKKDIEQKIQEIDSLVPKINCIIQGRLVNKIVVINNEIKAKEMKLKFLKT